MEMIVISEDVLALERRPYTKDLLELIRDLIYDRLETIKQKDLTYVKGPNPKLETPVYAEIRKVLAELEILQDYERGCKRSLLAVRYLASVGDPKNQDRGA